MSLDDALQEQVLPKRPSRDTSSIHGCPSSSSFGSPKSRDEVSFPPERWRILITDVLVFCQHLSAWRVAFTNLTIRSLLLHALKTHGHCRRVEAGKVWEVNNPCHSRLPTSRNRPAFRIHAVRTRRPHRLEMLGVLLSYDWDCCVPLIVLTLLGQYPLTRQLQSHRQRYRFTHLYVEVVIGGPSHLLHTDS